MVRISRCQPTGLDLPVRGCSKNAEVIAMLSACNVSTIVVWLCSIEPIARNAARKDVDKPKELTSTNHAHKRMAPAAEAGDGKSWIRYIGLGT